MINNNIDNNDYYDYTNNNIINMILNIIEDMIFSYIYENMINSEY
jgi:hypothetical protein